MNRNLFSLLSLFLLVLGCAIFSEIPKSYSQTQDAPGIQPLLEPKGQSIHSLLPIDVRPLLLPNEIEQFLRKLEGVSPDWSMLRHTDITEQSERLFQFNRQRDKARQANTDLLEKQIAFAWAGFLRDYQPETQGFSLALGPEHIHTSWGVVRFKPINLPDYLVTIPSIKLKKHVLASKERGHPVEIIIICIGTLAPDESLIYAFSHDSHQEGMILPVVSVQRLLYVYKPS